MLSVTNLRVSYGGAIAALRSVSLQVPAGAAVAVLGSNGAGKSTLLRAISGTLPDHGGGITDGDLTLDGVSLRGLAPARIVGAGVVQVPEGRGIFERLTVAENLRVGAFAVRSRTARATAHRRVLDLFPILHDRRHQRAGLLSGGEQQMLAIGRALMASPRVLLLDEPSLGLAPKMVARIGAVVSDINAAGTTVLLIEQNAAMALSVASHAFVLTVGEVTLSGAALELAGNSEVRDLYLGREAQVAVAKELAHGGAPALTRWTA
jgi:branched-chain amino acid transport system ATP-binding protein